MHPHTLNDTIFFSSVIIIALLVANTIWPVMQNTLKI